MVQSSKRKKKMRLPKNLSKRPDSEIIEKIFGKRVKRELDKLTENPETTEKTNDNQSMEE